MWKIVSQDIKDFNTASLWGGELFGKFDGHFCKEELNIVVAQSDEDFPIAPDGEYTFCSGIYVTVKNTVKIVDGEIVDDWSEEIDHIEPTISIADVVAADRNSWLNEGCYLNTFYPPQSGAIHYNISRS